MLAAVFARQDEINNETVLKPTLLNRRLSKTTGVPLCFVNFLVSCAQIGGTMNLCVAIFFGIR